MATRAVFVTDWEGVTKTLGEPEAVSYMQDACAKVMAAVLASVPVHHGSYAKHFNSTMRVAVEVEEGKGAVGTVATDDPLYHIIEFGSVNNPAYHPFGLGVQRAGLKFVPIGRGPSS
jgi:hypothetical protein